MIGEAGRVRAESILDDTCTVERADPDAVWTPGDSLPTGTTEVYAGPCALLAPQERREDSGGGDQRVRTTQTLALPVSAPQLKAGDLVTVASSPTPLFVRKPDERSHRVLQRVQVASTADLEGAP